MKEDYSLNGVRRRDFLRMGSLAGVYWPFSHVILAPCATPCSRGCSSGTIPCS